MAAKHQSFLDILIIFEALPRAKFIMKKELRWAPFIGLYALRIGSTPVARGDRSQGDEGDGRACRRRRGAAAARHLPAGHPGGAGGAAAVQGRRRGALRAARRPPACRRRPTPACSGDGAAYRRPGLAVVEFLPPIPPGLDVPLFMARIELEVEAASDRLMREAGFDPGARRSGNRSGAGLGQRRPALRRTPPDRFGPFAARGFRTSLAGFVRRQIRRAACGVRPVVDRIRRRF